MTTTSAPTSPSTASLASQPTTSRAALQRSAGIASLVSAGTYLVGFGLLLAHLAPEGFLDAKGDPAAALSFLLDHQLAMYLWHLVLYLVGGAAMAVLALGMHARLAPRAPGLANVGAAFGLVWSTVLLAAGMITLVGQRSVAELAATHRDQAESTWTTLTVIHDGLGGGIELVGALWILLVSVAALRTGLLGRGLAVQGIAVAVAGLLTLAPQVVEAGSAFGLGFIVWFVWAGLSLLRRPGHPDLATR
ncbi:hypothetical protein [Actinotalea sp.]|uniref:hypothetical protein n=1 Tax=Actinotalea sp. TaxID=1872145 RepID=UPI00356A26E0